MGRWHEKETKRLNERSMRRAIVASVVIVGLRYWWLAASIPPHAAWHYRLRQPLPTGGSFSLVWPVTRLPAIAAIIIVTVEPRGAASDLYASAYLTHGSGHPRSLEPFFFWATGADLSRRSGSLVRTHSRCTGPPNHRMDATGCVPVFAAGFNHQTKRQGESH